MVKEKGAAAPKEEEIMKTSKTGTVMAVLLVILGAVLALGVKFVFHACGGMDGMTPACKPAENAVCILGILILVLSVVTLIVKKRGLRLVLSLAIAVIAIVAAVLPNNILPLCQMPDMHCVAVMKPAVLLVGILTAVVAAISFAVNLRKAD